MTLQNERMARAIRDELKTPKHNLNDSSVTLLARVALGVIYMYLILLSYELMGTAGPVFVSVLFLVSFFIPVTYQAFTRRMREKRLHEHAELETPLDKAEEARQES